HPRVARAFVEARREHESRATPVLIYDAALLIENGLQASFEGVLLVTAPPDMQRARLMTRDGLTAAEADSRLAAQWPIERRRPCAGGVVENRGPGAEPGARVARVWKEMRGG